MRPTTTHDSHLLLAAMRDVFGEQDVLATSTIQTILNVEQDLPFGAYNDGKGIKPTQIASLLKRYRIKPKGVRIGDKTPRGYRREWFSDAWERYLPATPATTQAQSQKQGVSTRNKTPMLRLAKTPQIRMGSGMLRMLRLQTPKGPCGTKRRSSDE